jgi:Ala-tRNA(Pro) deacylase
LRKSAADLTKKVGDTRISTKRRDFLDGKSIKYTVVSHSPAYTAQELASNMHVHGWDLAKTTIIKLDGKPAIAVLPAPCKVDFDKLRGVTGATAAELAMEDEVRALFPDVELGAMPPFGNLYGLPVYVDERLARDPSILFNAGTHTDAIRMDFVDFKRLVEPAIRSFGVLDMPRFASTRR